MPAGRVRTFSHSLSHNGSFAGENPPQQIILSTIHSLAKDPRTNAEQTLTPPAGTLDDPIVVKSYGDEQYLGCTGFPVDSHTVLWLTTSRDRPIERCPECGSVYKLEYVGPQDSGHHDEHGGHGHDSHADADGSHNYGGEPKTLADYVRPEYR